MDQQCYKESSCSSGIPERGGFEYRVNIAHDGTKSATIVSYTGDAEELTIPCALDGAEVHEIGPYAFEDNDRLRTVVIPDTVAVIDAGAFMSCSALRQIRLPDRMELIGDNAFEHCCHLEMVNTPSHVCDAGSYIFRDCPRLPRGVAGNCVFMPLRWYGPAEERQATEARCPFSFFLHGQAQAPEKYLRDTEGLEWSMAELYEFGFFESYGDPQRRMDLYVVTVTDEARMADLKSVLLQCGMMIGHYRTQFKKARFQMLCSEQHLRFHGIAWKAVPPEQCRLYSDRFNAGCRTEDLTLLAPGELNRIIGSMQIRNAEYAEKLKRIVDSFGKIPVIQIDYGGSSAESTGWIGISENRILIMDDDYYYG